MQEKLSTRFEIVTENLVKKEQRRRATRADDERASLRRGSHAVRARRGAAPERQRSPKLVPAATLSPADLRIAATGRHRPSFWLVQTFVYGDRCLV